MLKSTIYVLKMAQKLIDMQYVNDTENQRIFLPLYSIPVSLHLLSKPKIYD